MGWTLVFGLVFLSCHACFGDLRVSDHDLNVAVKYAQDYVSRMHRLEKSLAASDVDVEDGSPSHGQLIDSLPSPEALAHGRSAMVANRASQYLSQRHCRRHHISQSDCLESMRKWSLENTSLRNKCAVQFGAVKCQNTGKYRTFDGSCNHVTHPSWGQAFSPYKRLLPADYADGILEPRRSASKKPLPPARQVSNILVPDNNKPDKESTLALPQWALFIANDLFQTALHKMVHTGNSIECCRPDGKQLTPRYLHPHCLQLTIPEDDPDYSPFGAKCMNYVRSLTSLRDLCNFGPADQMNQATHYLDASMIYGTTASRSIALRALSGGRLATSEKNNQQYLPLSVAPEVQCQVNSNQSVCFHSGDSRVNQHPQHTVMFTVWVREHNRIATALAAVNPHWEDKRLFLEARRVVIAEIQHITYKNWLPLILGKTFAKKRGFEVKPKGFGTVFSSDVDPTVSNEFATAGFNFVSSLLQNEIRLFDENRETNDFLILQDYFNKPEVTQSGGNFDKLVRGLAFQQSQKMDAFVVDDMTSKLFKGSQRFGQDVMSLDIQRGRDHGLPGYSAVRRFCNLPANTKFETFADTIPKSSVERLKNVYANPEDVDLVVGAILETPVEGAKVGPTLQCLLSEQFSRTRHGDRFFYDHPDVFTEAQINELKKANLARVMCDNTEGVQFMQADVFQMPSSNNPLVSCSDSRIRQINLSAWKDR